ncbi:MAG: hypothetical protein SV201_15475, partial [Pseudomonadota bacterium]|nr:hypothetical protein [Pseudomonadota bacterium]
MIFAKDLFHKQQRDPTRNPRNPSLLLSPAAPGKSTPAGSRAAFFPVLLADKKNLPTQCSTGRAQAKDGLKWGLSLVARGSLETGHLN